MIEIELCYNLLEPARDKVWGDGGAHDNDFDAQVSLLNNRENVMNC